MYELSAMTGDAVHAHAWAAYQNGKREACGLIVRGGAEDVYVPCRNIADDDRQRDSFKIDPRDWAAAEDAGEIVAVVHSHPDASAHPSDADRLMCSRTGVPWLIISMPSGVILQCEPSPSGMLPLVGREFHHGIVDCYTLVRDYYLQRLGIELPDFERTDEWWSAGQNLYRENFESAGFVEVGSAADTQPAEHDVLLMMIKSDVENHAAIFEDPARGLILHHLWGRPSGHDVWGGYWKRHTTAVLRHKSLIGGVHA